jgi:hypothetical protein
MARRQITQSANHQIIHYFLCSGKRRFAPLRLFVEIFAAGVYACHPSRAPVRLYL